MKKFSLVIVIAAVSLLLCNVNVFADDIKVGGGGASISSVFNPVRPYFEKATGIYMVILQSTPKDGLKDLLSGKIDAAVAAVPLEGMIDGLKKDGVDVDAAVLQQTVVGQNRTVVFVHEDNPVTTLSKEQLKGIFTGKLTNWKEVGGADKEIIVVWGKKTPGQNGLFSKQILDGEPVTAAVLDAVDYASIKETVAANPEGIGIDPFGMADSTIKVIETNPEITSPVILITKGKPSQNIQKLIDYVNGEGQKYVRK